MNDLIPKITRAQVNAGEHAVLKSLAERGLADPSNPYYRPPQNLEESAVDRQEFLDSFYFKRGPCCAGCDWWRHMNSRAGDCTKTKPVPGPERWAMLDMSHITMVPKPAAGHIVTPYDHVCGDFKDEFDWGSLPLAYRKRIGEPTVNATP